LTEIGTILLDLLREAWIALAGALGIFVVLALLTQVLRAAGASTIGARVWVSEAAAAGGALLVLAFFAFLGVPAVVAAAQAAIPAGGGCGPVGELGALAARLIAALAALRILRALVGMALAVSAGGSTTLSGALLEAGEAVLGMTLAAAAMPITGHFLGVC
jgi:hypothetical protein